MTPTADNTRRLHEHLRTAIALVRLLDADLESSEQRYSFDMGVMAAADVLDAIKREVQNLTREAVRFESINPGRDAWPETVPERLLFRPMAPVPVLPGDIIGVIAERIRGTLAITAAAIRQGDVYVYSNDVSATLDAVRGMLEQIHAVLGKVQVDQTPGMGTIYRPDMGPSKAWPGEAAA